MLKKTDNGNLAAKLELRRHFLAKYHATEPAHVLDCCQGSAVIWGQLRKEFVLGSYWGVDQKPKKGRLKIDSVRVLVQPGWSQNVIDIDTYGSPWKHWLALLPHVCKPLTVFLTIGQVQIGGASLLRVAREALGLGSLNPPNAIAAILNKFAISYLLTRSYDYGIMLSQVSEVVSAGNARYLGIRLEKVNG